MPDFESLKQRIEILERKQDRLLQDLHDERAASQIESEQPLWLAKTTTSGTYPPDPSTAFEIVFVDAYHAEFAGTPSFATAEHSASAQRVGYSISGHIEEDTLVAVFRQNGKYWILPIPSSEEPWPGGGNTQWLTTNFSSFPTPTPDTTVQVTESKIVDFTNAVTTGSITGASFDGINKWTLAAGTYLVIWNASCDANDVTEQYSPGEEFTDNLKVGSARLHLIDGAGTVYPEQGGYVTVSMPYEMSSSTGDQHRLVLEEEGTVQLKMWHENSTTADNAGVRIFHAKMHFIRF